MRRVSLQAAAAGLVVALAVSGLSAMSAADDVEVFIQPNVAVNGGLLAYFLTDNTREFVQCNMRGACGQLDSILCSGPRLPG